MPSAARILRLAPTISSSMRDVAIRIRSVARRAARNAAIRVAAARRTAPRVAAMTARSVRCTPLHARRAAERRLCPLYRVATSPCTAPTVSSRRLAAPAGKRHSFALNSLPSGRLFSFGPLARETQDRVNASRGRNPGTTRTPRNDGPISSRNERL